MNKLAQLKSVQEIDKDIYSLSHRIAAIPRALEDFKHGIETAREAVRSAEQALKDFQIKQKAKEVELGAKEEQMRKLEHQLNLVKTNQEYTALRKEIGNAKADSSMLEEDILKLMEEADAYRARISETKASLKKTSEQADAEERHLLEEKKRLEDELETLKTKKKELTQGIDAELLNLYERILVKKDGLALVPVVNGACAGCSMQLRPQLFDQIHMQGTVVICENCSRILYLE
jgi:predicted  nucleic acid-binding Zn-ribbon protein